MSDDDGSSVQPRARGWRLSSGTARALLVAVVSPIIVGVALLLIEYNVFQGDDGDPTATVGAGAPSTSTTSSVPPGPADADLSLSASSGPPGAELTVSGSGFAPGETIVLHFESRGVGQTQADGQGAFSGVRVEVPSDWTMRGAFAFTATGQSSGRSPSASFEVT